MRIFDKIPNEISLSGLASRPWLIVPVCSALHLTYSVGLLVDSSISKITALHFAYYLMGRFLFLGLAFAAVCAVVPMVTKLGPKAIHMYLWPQQFFLCLMAASTIWASYRGMYPDGYAAGHIFIFADQAFALWLMFGHLGALIRNARFNM